MVDAVVVDGADHGADSPPAIGRHAALLNEPGQLARVRQVRRDDIGRVDHAGSIDMRSDGVRHGQPRRAQLAQQPPFAKRAHALRAEPEIMIVDEPRDEAAAPIVAQHPRFGAVGDDQHFAAPRSLDRDGAGAPPLAGVEPACDRRLGAIGGDEHEMRPVGDELLVGVHQWLSARRFARSVSTARSTVAGAGR